MSAAFGDLSGTLHSGVAAKVGPAGKVEISCVRAGDAESPARRTVSLKYVAQGTEVYRYAGRAYAVSAGTFLVLPEGHEGEAGVRKRDGVALGMCVFLPERAVVVPPSPRLDEPLVFPAVCSALGRLLAATHGAMLRSRLAAPRLAQRLLSVVDDRFEPFLVDTVRALDGIDAAKPATRYEALRRLNVARAYLHEVDDRPVELAELAGHAAVSRFQLARGFGDCFGAPPAAYHRRVRLDRARDELRAGRLNCTEAAMRFGFGDVAHFSRAYRSVFGHPPSAERRLVSQIRNSEQAWFGSGR